MGTRKGVRKDAGGRTARNSDAYGYVDLRQGYGFQRDLAGFGSDVQGRMRREPSSFGSVRYAPSDTSLGGEAFPSTQKFCLDRPALVRARTKI